MGYLILGSGSKYSSWAEVTIVAMVFMLHLGLVLPKVLSVTPRHQSDTTGCFRMGRRLELCHAQQLKLHQFCWRQVRDYLRMAKMLFKSVPLILCFVYLPKKSSTCTHCLLPNTHALLFRILCFELLTQVLPAAQIQIKDFPANAPVQQMGVFSIVFSARIFNLKKKSPFGDIQIQEIQFIKLTVQVIN